MLLLQRQAYDVLKNHVSTVGFRSVLLAIVLDPESNITSRMLAISQLKNVAPGYWSRVREDSSHYLVRMRDEERDAIKHQLLQCMFEEIDDKVASYMSDIVSIIARTEFPKYWPDLIPSILSRLGRACEGAAADLALRVTSTGSNNLEDESFSSPAARVVRRSTQAFNDVMGALASKRMPGSVQELRAIIVENFGMMVEAWVEFSTSLVTPFAEEQLAGTAITENEYLLDQLTVLSTIVASLTKFLAFAFEHAAREIFENQQVEPVFVRLGECIMQLEKALEISLPRAPELEMVRGNLSLIRGYATTAVLHAQKNAPFEFHQYIPAFVELFTDIIKMRASKKRDRAEKDLANELRSCGRNDDDDEGKYGDDDGEEEEDDDDEVNEAAARRLGETARGSSICSLSAMNFLAAMLTCTAYRGEDYDGGGKGLLDDAKDIHSALVMQSVKLTGTLGEVDEQAIKAVRDTLNAVVTDEWVSSVAELVVAGYLPWSKNERKKWREEALLFFNAQQDARSDIDEHAAAENLLVALADRKPRIVLPKLLDWLTERVQSESESQGPVVGLTPRGEIATDESGRRLLTANIAYERMVTDAVLQAVGRLLPEFKRHDVDLNDFINYICERSHAVFAATGDDVSGLTMFNAPVSTVILYRSAKLTHDLVPHIDMQVLGRLIEILTRSLQIGDPVVKMQVATTLEHITATKHNENLGAILAEGLVEAGQNEAAIESTMVYMMVHSLLKHAVETRSAEVARSALHTVSQVIACLNDAVEPLVPMLSQALSALWDISAAAELRSIRSSIIDILSSMVVGLKGHSQGLHQMVLIVLNKSMNIDGLDNGEQKGGNADDEDDEGANDLTLFEDGLELWKSTLANAVEMTDGLLACFKNWLSYYREYDETISTAAEILESYAYLGGDAILENYSQQLSVVFPSLLLRISDEMELALLMAPLQTFAELYPQQTLQVFRHALVFLLQHIRLSHEDHRNAFASQTIRKFLLVFAQLLVHDPQATLQFLSSVGPDDATDPDLGVSAGYVDMPSGCFTLITEMLVDHAAEMSPLYRSKLAGLALAQCLPLCEQKDLAINILVTCAGIVAAEDATTELVDTLQDVSQCAPEERTEVYRVQCIANESPVYNHPLRAFVHERLTEGGKENGEAWVRELLGSVDPKVVASLQLH